MDSNSFMTQAMRYDHLQRLLKQYELEALNSLRGPATLSGTVDSIPGSSSAMMNGSCQQQTHSQAGATTATTSEVEKTAMSSLFSAASALYRQNKTPSLTSASARRNEQSDACASAERVLNADRSVLQQQETLLKEILTLRGAIPVQPLPVLTAQDRTSGAAERKDTLLEGEVITCFVVGGEKRLCLPQVLNTVLRNVSMVDINRACSELNIHCGHCTPEQLLVLKIAGVVSATTASCALITKTDAERLCDYLLRQKRKEYRPVPSHAMASSRGETRNRMVPFAVQHQRSSSIGAVSETTQSSARLSFLSGRQHASVAKEMNVKADRDISVIHYCFGRCRGLYRPSLYASPSAECIECNECGQLFAPDRFVVHSHGNQERRTCHWGFDSANWRAYLHLTDEDECEENRKILDEMKLRFDVTGLTKRRLDAVADAAGGESTKLADVDNLPPPGKRIRCDAGEWNQQERPTAVTTGPVLKDPNDKLAASIVSVSGPASILPSSDQANLPYFLCDPLLLAAYYQAALAAAAATIRVATVPQANSNATNVIPPSLLPQSMIAPAFEAPQTQQQSAMTGASQALDGFVMKTGNFPGEAYQQQSQQPTRERPLLDEATATAALKLLQLHAGGGGEDISLEKLIGAVQPEDNQKAGQLNCDGYDCDEKANTLSSPSKSFNHQPQAALSLSFCKEPFKKQLLHLFTIEQQQKEEQRRHEEQRKDLPRDTDLSQRGLVEIVVNDDERKGQRPLTPQRPRHSSSGSEAGKVDGDIATPDTQVADELSVSSSDNEGASGEVSLDELLRRYIVDADGLKTVRAKIAENQRYLEQKLDAVSAENRLLHAECLRLRAKQLQQQQNQEQAAMAANLLSKSGIGNFVGFLPKQFTL